MRNIRWKYCVLENVIFDRISYPLNEMLEEYTKCLFVAANCKLNREVDEKKSSRFTIFARIESFIIYHVYKVFPYRWYDQRGGDSA